MVLKYEGCCLPSLLRCIKFRLVFNFCWVSFWGYIHFSLMWTMQDLLHWQSPTFSMLIRKLPTSYSMVSLLCEPANIFFYSTNCKSSLIEYFTDLWLKKKKIRKSFLKRSILVCFGVSFCWLLLIGVCLFCLFLLKHNCGFLLMFCYGEYRDSDKQFRPYPAKHSQYRLRIYKEIHWSQKTTGINSSKKTESILLTFTVVGGGMMIPLICM